MQNNQPEVSVIIPVHNGERWLQETVDSVIQQAFKNWELIIVDDGSTDQTSTLIRKILSCDARIKSLTQINQGVSSARNNGYKISKGRFIAFLDADDIWLPSNLELKVNKLLNANFGMVHSDAELISASGSPINIIQSGNEGPLLFPLLEWKTTQVPGPSSVLIKREVLETIGLFDEQLSTSADQDFFIRVASRFLIGRVPLVTWRYRIHENNMHKNIARMEHDVIQVFRKAEKASLFKNSWHKRKCFANMYWILAASWGGDGKDLMRSSKFVWLAIQSNPLIIFKLPTKFLKWLNA